MTRVTRHKLPSVHGPGRQGKTSHTTKPKYLQSENQNWLGEADLINLATTTTTTGTDWAH